MSFWGVLLAVALGMLLRDVINGAIAGLEDRRRSNAELRARGLHPDQMEERERQKRIYSASAEGRAWQEKQREMSPFS
jgi:hypothetical protein